MEFFFVVVVDSIQEPGPNLNTRDYRDYTQMFSNMYLEKNHMIQIENVQFHFNFTCEK